MRTTNERLLNVCCPCGAKIIHLRTFCSETLKSVGWEKIGNQWYCDECAPYKETK